MSTQPSPDGFSHLAKRNDHSIGSMVDRLGALSAFIGRAMEFIELNGFPLFAGELYSRLQTSFRTRCLSHKLQTCGLKIGPRSYFRGLSKMKIGDNFAAGEGLWMEAVTRFRNQRFNPLITIGQCVSVSNWVHIGCTHEITIGEYTLIGSKVVIVDHNHGQYVISHSSPMVPPAMRTLDAESSVTIGRNVWLGDSVAVLPGARIGEGSVIAANSVVSGEIPPFTIAAGVPARVIKRFDFTTQQWIRPNAN